VFSLTCRPRLVKRGRFGCLLCRKVLKFSYLGVGSRTAISFPASRDSYFLVTFLDSLEAEAKVIRGSLF